MVRIAAIGRTKVSADEQVIVPHARVGMLGELAERTSPMAGPSEPLMDSLYGWAASVGHDLNGEDAGPVVVDVDANISIAP